MKCYYCESELIKDSFGFLCPNEKCNSINGANIELVFFDGEKHWRKNEQLHRENGPAVEAANGDKYWYINGKIHREDGPAVERSYGGKEYWVDDQRHREDGPAIERSCGITEYWVNGKKIK